MLSHFKNLLHAKNGFVNDFTVEINNYRINATDELNALYNQFNKDDKNLILIVSGEEK